MEPVSRIAYRGGYKYQLAQPFVIDTPVTPSKAITTEYISLTAAGRMVIARSYAWDGASGPSIDTVASMRASLVHDALYQLMRLGLLSFDQWRLPADKFFKKLCRDDGMGAIRAAIWFAAIRAGGLWWPGSGSGEHVLYAPRLPT